MQLLRTQLSISLQQRIILLFNGPDNFPNLPIPVVATMCRFIRFSPATDFAITESKAKLYCSWRQKKSESFCPFF